MVLYNSRETLKNYDLLPKERLDKASKAIKHGRLAVGVEFALRKIVDVAKVLKEPADAAAAVKMAKKTADAALVKISERGVVIPVFLKQALEHTSKMAVPGEGKP